MGSALSSHGVDAATVLSAAAETVAATTSKAATRIGSEAFAAWVATSLIKTVGNVIVSGKDNGNAKATPTRDEGDIALARAASMGIVQTSSSVAKLCDHSLGLVTQGIGSLQDFTSSFRLICTLLALFMAAGIARRGTDSPHAFISNGSWVMFCLVSLIAMMVVWSFLLAIHAPPGANPSIVAAQRMQGYGDCFDDASFNERLHSTIADIVAAAHPQQHLWVVTVNVKPGTNQIASKEATVHGDVIHSTQHDAPIRNPRTGSLFKAHVLRSGNVFNHSESVGLSSIKVTTTPHNMWTYSEPSRHYQFHAVGTVGDVHSGGHVPHVRRTVPALKN
ncbi:hypothetical protein CF327_g2534 [Tilletia walkeri]|nr:hypothetical protein CF327_g2534 [Tilletia walkeri]